MKNLAYSKFLPICGLAVAAAGCASTETGLAYDPYGAAEYTGAHQLYAVDKVAPLDTPVQVDENGQPLQVVAYSGVEGARQVHQLYGARVAEQLDGKCEPFVRISQNESLIDIADYCDVPMSALVDYNPAIDNPYLIRVGQIIEVPGGRYQTGNGLAAAASDLANIYTVRAGESLEEVAYRFNVSTSAIANVNQGANLAYLQPGDQLVIPGRSQGGVTVVVPSPSVYDGSESWEGYAATGSGAGHSGFGHDSVTALMPYNLGPIDAEASANGRMVKPTLAVDQSLAPAGRRVSVRLENVKPGERVTFYRGSNLQDMKAMKPVRADENGVAEQSYRVKKKKSDMGGVVFQATREDSGETYYSERVGVLKIQDPEDVVLDDDLDEDDWDGDEN
jgi:LysM repeat protein